MAVKVYSISDRRIIELLTENDLEGFREYLKEEEFLYFEEPKEFSSEKEALAYCARLGKGQDERGIIELYPLRSCEKADLPFIELIENY